MVSNAEHLKVGGSAIMLEAVLMMDMQEAPLV
jgi:hypothetical protein